MLLDTKQLTWCYMCTMMLHNLVNKNHDAGWVVVFYINTRRPLQTTLKTNEQWPTPYLILSATSCRSISCRSRIWSALPKLTNRNTNAHHTRRARPSTTSNTNRSLQIHCLINRQLCCQTKKIIAINMIFCWVRDRTYQRQLCI